MEFGSITGEAISALAGAVGAYLIIRKKLSSDNLEIAKNSSERSFVEMLETHMNIARQELQVSEAARHSAEEKIRVLSDDIERLNSRMQLLQSLITRLSASLSESSAQLKRLENERSQ